MPLDRASTLRKDPIWLQAQLSSNKSQFYFFWRGKFLYLEQKICVFTKEIDSRLKRNFTDAEVFAEVVHASNPTFLGTKADVAHFVCDLSQMAEDDIGHRLIKLAIDNIKFIDFRRSLSLLRP